MSTQIMSYYIPSNSNIPKGHIYALYLNNNKNMDLSSILNTQTITLNDIIPTPKGNISKQAQITISKEDYTRLLELNNLSHQISNKRNDVIQAFIQNETRATVELAKINSERQELIKKLTKGKDVS